MQCSAKAKSSGKRCLRSAIAGGLTCRVHGGAARQVRQAAAVRISEAQALAALANMQPEPVADPLFELSLLAGEASQWRTLLRDRVSQLASLGYAGATGEQTRAAVQLYTQSLDRLERVLSTIARLNIDERLAAISERQSAVIITALNQGLLAGGVDNTTAHVVRSTMARHLTAVRRAA